jgi:hypothetical protein
VLSAMDGMDIIHEVKSCYRVEGGDQE